jgi:hypothetical protein
MSKSSKSKSTPLKTSNGTTAMLVRGENVRPTQLTPMESLAQCAAELDAIENCPIMHDDDVVHVLTPYGGRLEYTAREMKADLRKAAKGVFAAGFRAAAGISEQRLRDSVKERRQSPAPTEVIDIDATE